MIEVVKVEAVKNYLTWETDLQVYCKIPIGTLKRLNQVDTNVLAGELGEELMEQVLFHILKINLTHLI